MLLLFPHFCRVLELADEYNQEVTFVWCYASRRQCLKRVRRQQGDSPRRRAVRLRLISDAPIHLFQPVEGEDPDEVLDSMGECEGCWYTKVSKQRCQCSSGHVISGKLCSACLACSCACKYGQEGPVATLQSVAQQLHFRLEDVSRM